VNSADDTVAAVQQIGQHGCGTTVLESDA
jgi:hypothetical protein